MCLEQEYDMYICIYHTADAWGSKRAVEWTDDARYFGAKKKHEPPTLRVIGRVDDNWGFDGPPYNTPCGSGGDFPRKM
jgi:hypothetical protein